MLMYMHSHANRDTTANKGNTTKESHQQKDISSPQLQPRSLSVAEMFQGPERKPAAWVHYSVGTNAPLT